LRSRRGREPLGRRGSRRRFASNQLRLQFAALAHTLMIKLRRLAWRGAELERACTAIIRVKLIEIDAAVLRNTQHGPHSAAAGRGVS